MIVQNSNAQAKLGSSISEIKKEFATGYDLEIDFYQDKYMITTTNDDSYNHYFFDENEKCRITVIQPRSDSKVQSFIEYYNGKYAIISPKEWRWYNESGIAKIEFANNNGTMIFIWSIIEN